MAAITGGGLLARCLANEGVRFVFGLPCPEVDPLLAALDEHRIRLVPIRHEAAAVYMALGAYRTTGEVAAVLGNPGPGSANLLPGVVTARHEGVPVIVITAQHRPGIVYPSSPATFQGQDQLDVFRPAVKWGAPVFAWDRLPEVMRLACREMWSGRPGPVQLEVPMTTMYATGDPATTPVLPPERYRACTPRPCERALRQAAELLAAAQRPVLVAGSGVERADAGDALLAVVERLGCPVMSTMAGRGAVPTDHPGWVYGFGAGGDLARRDADVVLVVGSRLGNLDLPYDKYWGDPARQRVIQIDVDPRHIGVTRPITLGIVSDARDALEGLGRALDAVTLRRPDGSLARLRAAAAEWWERQREPVRQWRGPGIHPAHAMERIGEAFGRDAVYVVDGGNTSLWAHWFLPATRPRSYQAILELGMLGIGVPSAVGAKLAAPERDVVCVTGDGAAGFHFMELQSAAREGVDLTVVVFAEGSWTMEEPNERMLWGKTFGTAMGEVRWDRVAEGLGCRGWYVERLDELAAALGEARAAKGPAVVCLRSDRDANLAVPPEMLRRFVEVYQGPAG
jgi:acetolactate synthase-1/2/3 large subunit